MAEVLITLAIVGVVAVLVIPSLTVSVTNKARERQVEVSKVKFNKAAQLMALNNSIGPYYSDTYEFVQNLGKYLKINLVCRVGDNPSNLPPVGSCLGENYTTAKTADGDEVEISSLGLGGKSFGLKENDDNNDWSSSSIAFYTIDGTRYILSYNSKCDEVQPAVYQGNAAAGCIAGMVDVDGNKKPNQQGKDIYLIGSAKSLGAGNCLGKNAGLCYNAPISVQEMILAKGYVTLSECQSNSWGFPTEYCTAVIDTSANWFASAAKYCGGFSKIMSPEDAAGMIKYIYGLNSYTFYQSIYSVHWNDSMAARAAEFGIPDLTTLTNNWQVMSTDVSTVSNMKYVKFASLHSDSIGTGMSNAGTTYSVETIGNTIFLFCKAD